MVESDDGVVLGYAVLIRSENKVGLDGANDDVLHERVCVLELEQQVGCPRCDLLFLVSKLVDEQSQKVFFLFRLLLQQLPDVGYSTVARVLDFVVGPCLEDLQQLKVLFL